MKNLFNLKVIAIVAIIGLGLSLSSFKSETSQIKTVVLKM